MTSKHIQAPATVVMIRPHRFHPNPETASNNAFQRSDGQLSAKEIAKAAYSEVTAVAARLEQEGAKKKLPILSFPITGFQPIQVVCRHLPHVQSQPPKGKTRRYN